MADMIQFDHDYELLREAPAPRHEREAAVRARDALYHVWADPNLPTELSDLVKAAHDAADEWCDDNC